MKNSVFQRWFLPGFLFQSVIIGGGYATGRELIEFFLGAGPLAGLLSLVLVTLGFSICMAIAFELSRMTRTYDYRTFLKQLLGRGWFVYEILFLVLVLLILAVLGAASGELVSANFGIPPIVGTVALIALIGILVFKGTELIEKVLAGWSFLLYAVYAVLIFFYLKDHGHKLPAIFAADDLSGPWAINTIRYIGYSLTAIPMILFCVRHMESRKDAFIAGACAGPIGMIPAILFFLGMTTSYPEILDIPVPADYMMQQLSFAWLSVIFYVVVYGTFVETGTALLHGINERIDHVFIEKSLQMPRWLRPAIAVTSLTIAAILAAYFGIIELVSKGYGTMTWLFLLVIFVPLVTVGVWRIAKGNSA